MTKSQISIHKHASSVRFLRYPMCALASLTASIHVQSCSTGGENCSDEQSFALTVCSCQSINLTNCDVHMVIIVNLFISKARILKVADATSVLHDHKSHQSLQIKGTNINRYATSDLHTDALHACQLISIWHLLSNITPSVLHKLAVQATETANTSITIC